MQDFKQYLNPILKQVGEISDTSDIEPNGYLEIEEYPHLIGLINLLDVDIKKGLKQIHFLEEQLEHFNWIIDNETGDDKMDAIKEYNKLLGEMDVVMERVNRALDTLDEPYFGKIIFDRKESEKLKAKKLPVYVGKFAYFDKNSNTPLISDWRSPIANLYYNYAGPTEEASFISPIGEQRGSIKEKRQFEIGNGRFNNVYDVKSGNVATDQFLLNQLNKRMGKKLKEIVSTIQAQQNTIIRDEIDKPVLIQGVAGSGKTTIILHRLAYLLYTFEEKIKPENSLIIAPNMVFIDYIGDVLPSLGVKGIIQNTFLHWSRDILDFTDKYVLNDHETDEVKLVKGSIEFMELVEKYIERFEVGFFEHMPTSVAFDIEEQYYEMKEKNPNMSMRELVGLSMEATFAQRRISKRGSVFSPSNISSEQDRLEKVKNYIKKSFNVYKIYKRMYSEMNMNEGSKISNDQWSQIVSQSTSGFTLKRGFLGYAMSDLAPLLMIRQYLDGTKEDRYDYILVDEAQDMSPMQLLVLREFSKRENITYAGDTAQSIVPPYHITDWTDLISEIGKRGDQEVTYHVLNRSYRSTNEIISFANQILEEHFPDSYSLPEAVLRHGDEVEVVHTNSSTTKDSSSYTRLTELIHEAIDKETSSIAIITKDDDSADTLYTKLKNENFSYPIFSYKQEDFHAGIQVLPVKYAKGLEFDTVMIVDISEENYSDVDDSRLLYVAMTRALHSLSVLIPKDKPSQLIPEKIIKASS